MGTGLDRNILEILTRRHALSVNAAAAEFGVSGATVRRVFKRLSDLGEVRRVHGGIEEFNHKLDPAPSYLLRMQWAAEIKTKLAELTLEYLKDCRTLFVDGGTTTAHLGGFLSDPKLRIVTNSLLLNDVVSRRCGSGGGPEIILTGGLVNRKSAIMIGPEAENTLDHFHADVAVISGTAIDNRFLYDNMEEPAAVQRRMIENADRTIIVADAAKFGKAAPSAVVPVERISLVITNFVSDNYEVIQRMKDKGVQFAFIRNGESRRFRWNSRLC